MTTIDCLKLEKNLSDYPKTHIPKVIFLDIDGPVIPVNVSLYESYYRLVYDIDAIDNLNFLCEMTGAKIVTNSWHNSIDYLGSELQEDLILFGIDPRHFHSNHKTIYPEIDYKKINSPVRGIGRLYAIHDWLQKNGEHHWVCFDDRLFTGLENLIHIDDGLGITADHMDRAFDILTMFGE